MLDWSLCINSTTWKPSILKDEWHYGDGNVVLFKAANGDDKQDHEDEETEHVPIRTVSEKPQ